MIHFSLTTSMAITSLLSFIISAFLLGLSKDEKFNYAQTSYLLLAMAYASIGFRVGIQLLDAQGIAQLNLLGDVFYILFFTFIWLGIRFYVLPKPFNLMLLVLPLLLIIWTLFAHATAILSPWLSLPEHITGATLFALSGHHLWKIYKRNANWYFMILAWMLWLQGASNLTYPFTRLTWWAPYGFATIAFLGTAIGMGLMLGAIREKQWELLQEINTRKEIENTLRDSEYFFKESQRTANIGSYKTDFIRGNWESSEVLDTIFGIDQRYTRSIQGWLNLVHPDDQAMMAQYLREEVIGKGNPFSKEYRIIRKNDGATRWVHGHGEVKFDGDGKVLSLIGTIHDITDRKHAELTMLENAGLHQALFNFAKDGIFTLSSEGEILEVNEALARMHGYTVDEMLHMQLKDLDTPSSAELAPERIRRILSGEKLTFEVEHFHKDGHVFPLEVSVNLISSGGKIILLNNHRDITERRAMQEKLEKSMNLLQDVLDTLQIPVFAKDIGGKYTMCNRAFLTFLGRAENEVLGKTVFDVSPSPLAAIYLQADLQLIKEGKTQQYETVVEGAMGPRTVMFTKNVMRNPGGEVIGLVGTIRDNTENKRVEEQQRLLETQLHQAQKMESLGRLAGGLAHDMNNVLGAILGIASANIETHPEESQAFRAFDIISNAAVHGGRMVKSLLSFARQSPAEELALDMNAILRDEIRLLERTTLSKIHFEMDLGYDLQPICGDASALTHAIMNLCVNAVDAMPENGTLTLRTRNCDKDWIEVLMEDTGTGMPKEVLEKAMDPFFTTKGIGKGTGLGLSMVYSTVKAHHGQIDIQSQLGQGTCVRMRFPTCEVVNSSPKPKVEPLPESSPRSLTLLLVDDDELIQSSLKEILDVLGHNSVIVSCGEEALARLEAGFEPDLVILDMNMPGLGGTGTLPRLRTLCPTMPVLLATGRVDQAALDLVRIHKFVTLLPKPFSMRELQQLILRSLHL